MPEIEHDLAKSWRNSEKGRISSTWMLITQSCWNQNYLDPFERQRLWKFKQNFKLGILTSWLEKGFPNCSHKTVSGVLTAYVPRLISPCCLIFCFAFRGPSSGPPGNVRMIFSNLLMTRGHRRMHVQVCSCSLTLQSLRRMPTLSYQGTDYRIASQRTGNVHFKYPLSSIMVLIKVETDGGGISSWTDFISGQAWCHNKWQNGCQCNRLKRRIEQQTSKFAPILELKFHGEIKGLNTKPDANPLRRYYH